MKDTLRQAFLSLAILVLSFSLAVAQSPNPVPWGLMGSIPWGPTNLGTITSASTIYANQMLGGTQATVNSAVNLTTDTAANICAMFTSGQVAGGGYIQYNWEWDVYNAGSATGTIVGGTGVTLQTPGTFTVATVNLHRFRIVLNSCVAGSQAVSIYSLGTSAAY